MNEAQDKLLLDQRDEIKMLKEVLDARDKEVKDNLKEFQTAFLKMAHFASLPCCAECCSAEKGKKEKKN